MRRNRLALIAVILASLSLGGMSTYLLDKVYSIRAERDLVIQQATGNDCTRCNHHEDVLFIGDSIIANFPLKAMLPSGIPIMNGGVIGYQMKQIAQNYHNATFPHHHILVVEGGINDILACVAQNKDKNQTVKIILESYERIYRDAILADRSVIVCSILPITDKFLFTDRHAIVLPSKFPVKAANDLIRTVNEGLRKIAATNHAQFCDIYSAVVDNKGEIQRGLVYTDGCHLNAFGYKVVADTIAKLL
jgi:lysophospholipase L1-like esterase